MSAGSTTTAPSRRSTPMRRLGQAVGRVAVAEELLAGHADPRAAQAGRIEERGVVRRDVARGGGGRAVARIGAGQRAEQRRRVGHGAAERAGGVLGVRDGDDARPAHQPDRRLEAHDAAGRRRADDRAVGLGADGHRAEVGGDGRAPSPSSSRTGFRSSTNGLRHWPPRALQPLDERVERMLAHSLMFALASRTAPAARSRSATCESRGRDRALERQRAGRGRHPVGGVDVVLEQHRNAVQRAARRPWPPAPVELLGDGERVGVGLDDRLERDARPVHRGDPLEVELGDRAAPCSGPRPCPPAARRR